MMGSSRGYYTRADMIRTEIKIKGNQNFPSCNERSVYTAYKLKEEGMRVFFWERIKVGKETVW